MHVEVRFSDLLAIYRAELLERGRALLARACHRLEERRHLYLHLG